MSEAKKKPGPKPEIFKVPLSFDDAIEAALKTKPPAKGAAKKPRRKRAR